MENDFAATQYGLSIQYLLMQVNAKLQKAGWAKSIDAEAWLMNWLDTPNAAFNGVCPRILLQAASADSNHSKAK